MNPVQTALTRAVNKAIADGAPVYANQPAERLPRFAIGAQFRPVGPRGKNAVYTVIDVLTTTGQVGGVLKIEYLAEHLFCGQQVRSIECETTVARGLVY